MTKSNGVSWRDQVRQQFNNRPASATVEALAVELGVSESWLRLFGRGKIDNPGIMTVEKLSKLLDKLNKKN